MLAVYPSYCMDAKHNTSHPSIYCLACNMYFFALRFSQILFVWVFRFHDQVHICLKLDLYAEIILSLSLRFHDQVHIFCFCRLWDLGQQRCVHSYAIHTDSVWALATTPSFNRVYSGGRDLSVSSSILVRCCP